jgi:hypothetical protein
MKINKIFAVAAFLSIASASSALAAINTVNADLTLGTAPNTTVIKPSKNVLVQYTAGTTLSTGHSTYAIQSHHVSGTKAYASSSGDTKIYMIDDVSTSTITGTVAAPAVGSSMSSSGYTAM